MKSYFVYMFLDEEETPLYIGSSINLVQRVEKQHFISPYGNLSAECVYRTKSILYHECVSSEDMKIKERYLINILEPVYNEQLNNKNKFSFSIDISWKYLSLNKEVALKKRTQILKKKIPKKTIAIRIYEKDYYEFQDWGLYKYLNQMPTDGVAFCGWENINLGTAIGDGIRLVCSKIDLSIVDDFSKAKRKKRKEHKDKIRASSAQLTEEEIRLIKKIIDYRILVDKIDDFTTYDVYSYLLLELKREYPKLQEFFQELIIKRQQNKK